MSGETTDRFDGALLEAYGKGLEAGRHAAVTVLRERLAVVRQLVENHNGRPTMAYWLGGFEELEMMVMKLGGKKDRGSTR